jgi:hypothetical protein
MRRLGHAAAYERFFWLNPARSPRLARAVWTALAAGVLTVAGLAACTRTTEATGHIAPAETTTSWQAPVLSPARPATAAPERTTAQADCAVIDGDKPDEAGFMQGWQNDVGRETGGSVDRAAFDYEWQAGVAGLPSLADIYQQIPASGLHDFTEYVCSHVTEFVDHRGGTTGDCWRPGGDQVMDSCITATPMFPYSTVVFAMNYCMGKNSGATYRRGDFELAARRLLCP